MLHKEITLLRNKKVNIDYFIKTRYNAGIVLNGWEVKSIKKKKFQILNSYVTVKSGELYVIGMYINCLHNKYDSSLNFRTRKLLLNKYEIKKILDLKNKTNISIVVTKCFIKKNFVKLEIAVVQGKKKYDKRNDIKNKDWEKKSAAIMKKFQ